MLNVTCGAAFSEDRVYRYRLSRLWDDDLPTISFCMLNPSTADEIKNDPTVERCQRRALAWGYGRLEVVNIFALRSTNPSGLYVHQDPIGPSNDEAIYAAAKTSDLMVLGWGVHGGFRRRGDKVIDTLLKEFKHIRVLKINIGGQPAHPLYLPYSLTPRPIQSTRIARHA